jgi:outer membrane protein assembly factor BamB
MSFIGIALIMLTVAGLGIAMVLSVPYRFISRRQRKAGRYITRACAAVTAGVALAAVAVTGASASAAAPRHLQTVQVTGAGTSLTATSPGAQLWVARYDNPGNGGATSVAASPDGKTVFVTGYTTTASGTEDYTTVAYNAATGAQLWAARYTDPGHTTDRAYSVAVSPDGKTVFVTGYTTTASGQDYATVAYNAATGAQLWAARYNDPSNDSAAVEVAVSPDGTAVFVTGTSGVDYATVAYNAATGAQLWVARYDGFGSGGNYGHSVAVSQNGKTVFVIGNSLGTNNGYDYATVAYNAATGHQLWAKRYNGASGGDRGANAVAVSGSTVFVTGSSYGGSTAGYDYATVAYSAATGAQLWVKRYDGPGSGGDQAYAVAVSPSGGTVFVTGYTDTNSNSSGFVYTTIAYSAATGTQQWVSSYNGPAKSTSEAYAVAVSPDGSTVYVTGTSIGGAGVGNEYATVAYNAATGAQLWVQRYDGAGGGSHAFSVAVSPTTGTVFVTGDSYDADPATGFDYVTIAYQG